MATRGGRSDSSERRLSCPLRQQSDRGRAEQHGCGGTAVRVNRGGEENKCLQRSVAWLWCRKPSFTENPRNEPKNTKHMGVDRGGM